MTEPVTNADDRQPGGSGAGSTLEGYDPADIELATSQGIVQMRVLAVLAERRVALEAAQLERDQWDKIVDYWKGQAEQSRATEAELQALNESQAQRIDSLIAEADRWQKLYVGALDATEPPAARGGTSQDGSNRHPTGPSAHGSAENDHLIPVEQAYGEVK